MRKILKPGVARLIFFCCFVNQVMRWQQVGYTQLIAIRPAQD